MELKKNPKADLSRRSTLFIQLGLVLVLLITWLAIEHKTYEKSNVDIGQVNYDEIEEEDVELVVELNTPPPPPPPPPAAPEVIEVVEDEAAVEETTIQSTESNQEEEVDVEEVEYAEEEEEIADVPFNVIENVPVFPGCEGQADNAGRKKCMSDKVKRFVNKKFNTGLGDQLGLSGINRIYVRFTINKKGDIVGVRARGPHPRLEKEAKRVVALLPKMTPGKQRGKSVGVTYNLPIVFQVQD